VHSLFIDYYYFLCVLVCQNLDGVVSIHYIANCKLDHELLYVLKLFLDSCSCFHINLRGLLYP